MSSAGAKLERPLAGPNSALATARLAQLALTTLLSIYPLSELLKLHELGDQRVETFLKHSRRILRSNAGIHDAPPDRGLWEKVAYSREKGKLCNPRTIALTFGMLRPQKRCGGASRGRSADVQVSSEWSCQAVPRPTDCAWIEEGSYRLVSVALEIRVLAPGQSALRFSSFSSSAQSSPPSALGIPAPPPVAKGPLALPPPPADPPLPPEPPPDAPPGRDDPAERLPGAPPPPDDPPLELPGPAADDRSLSKNDRPLSSCFTPCRPPEPAMAVEVREVDRSRVITGGVTAANLPQVLKKARRSSSSLPSRVTMRSPRFKILFTHILNGHSTKNFLCRPRVI